MDMVVGFDISTHLPGQPLFHGHPQLQSYLPSILEDITSMRGVSCGAGAEMQVSVAFKVNSDQDVPAKFQIYQQTIFDSLLQVEQEPLGGVRVVRRSRQETATSRRTYH